MAPPLAHPGCGLATRSQHCNSTGHYSHVTQLSRPSAHGALLPQLTSHTTHALEVDQDKNGAKLLPFTSTTLILIAGGPDRHRMTLHVHHTNPSPRYLR